MGFTPGKENAVILVLDAKNHAAIILTEKKGKEKSVVQVYNF